MKRIFIPVPQRMRDALDELCERTGLPIAEHVRRAIDAYMDQINKAKLKEKK